MERTPGEEQHERWRLAVAVDGSEGSREALGRAVGQTPSSRCLTITTGVRTQGPEAARPGVLVTYLQWMSGNA